VSEREGHPRGGEEREGGYREALGSWGMRRGSISYEVWEVITFLMTGFSTLVR
jgi:hypothetical protein